MGAYSYAPINYYLYTVAEGIFGVLSSASEINL